MSEDITFDARSGLYTRHIGEDKVYARTRQKDNLVYIDYVEAEVPLRGSGAAGRFMVDLAAILEQKDVKVVPICGYAALWFKRHPEYHTLLRS